MNNCSKLLCSLLICCNTVGIPVQVHIQYTQHNKSTAKIKFLPLKIMSTKKGGRWSTSGPEGIQLKRDIISGFSDGSLDLDKPDFMSLYRKEQVYQSFPKDSFRNHVRNAIADYRTAMSIRSKSSSSKSFIVV